MRIAPRTLLCGTSAVRVHVHVADTASTNCGSCALPPGDKASLAIGMSGCLWCDDSYQDRVREASQLASERSALLESIGDPTLTVGLSNTAIHAKIEDGEIAETCCGWSQTVIDLADGDPTKGNFFFGSPLAWAITLRGLGPMCLGSPGWRDDLQAGLAMARSADPMTQSARHHVYVGIPFDGAPLPDARTRTQRCATDAERSAMTSRLAWPGRRMGVALVHRRGMRIGTVGLEMLAKVGEQCLRGRQTCSR